MPAGLIDRKSLVSRHNVTLSKLDPLSPLSVGNGEFAYTVDLTGLQTFPEAHTAGMPLHTMAQWAWHRFPNTQKFTNEPATELYKVGDRMVPYLGKGGMGKEPPTPAATYLRGNPHRISLGRIGLLLPPGTTIDQLQNVSQTLDLWTGLITSKFTLLGQPVTVITAGHPTLDGIAVKIDSPLLLDGRLGIEIAFPAGRADWRNPADWEHPEIHTTSIWPRTNGCDFRHVQDSDSVHIRAAWDAGAQLESMGAHRFALHGTSTLSIAFSKTAFVDELPSAAQTIEASTKHWESFWNRGAAIDLSGTDDPRAKELERRIVLSQYQTAINCAGTIPPQETGLVTNSWFGKPHLEMHFWHAAHFALWNRIDLLERGLKWYDDILPKAHENAKRQGYTGARWPKMVGYDGEDSPSDVAVFLIWQQPHPIYYAELVYRQKPTPETLKRFATIVNDTAEFMSSYSRWDEPTKRYILGPALIPAQETYSNIRERLINPTYELCYWHWALSIAQQWRERSGQKRNEQWDKVINNLSRPTIRDGVYEAIEVEPYTINTDHPSMLQAYGNLPPTPLIDEKIMHATLKKVLKTWDWPTTWGWDYPVLAQCAARCNEPEIAIDALLMNVPKNTYLTNGHNYQAERLPLYLPGNGGLLLAVAMMAGGWDGSPPGVKTTGFPKGWNVKAEGFQPLP